MQGSRVRCILGLLSGHGSVRVLKAQTWWAGCGGQRDRQTSFSMRYRIAPAASPDVRTGAVGRLQEFAFDPIDTPGGVFAMAVLHQPASAGVPTGLHQLSRSDTAMVPSSWDCTFQCPDWAVLYVNVQPALFRSRY